MNCNWRKKTIQCLLYNFILHYIILYHIILCIYICVYMHMYIYWYIFIYLQNSFKLYGKNPENRQRPELSLRSKPDFWKSIYSDQVCIRKKLERKSKLHWFLKVKGRKDNHCIFLEKKYCSLYQFRSDVVYRSPDTTSNKVASS